jgi:hypothetical protein
MNDEARQLAARDRLMRHEAAKLTPEERLTRMAALQEHYFAMLQQSPECFDRFWRRNLRKRAIHHDPSTAQ